jgi:hypothetical protein
MNSYWKFPQELLVQNNVRHCKNIYEYGMFMKWNLYIVVYRVIALIFLFLPRNITKDFFIID